MLVVAEEDYMLELADCKLVLEGCKLVLVDYRLELVDYRLVQVSHKLVVHMQEVELLFHITLLLHHQASYFLILTWKSSISKSDLLKVSHNFY